MDKKLSNDSNKSGIDYVTEVKEFNSIINNLKGLL
jgi:hypothetical protein